MGELRMVGEPAGERLDGDDAGLDRLGGVPAFPFAFRVGGVAVDAVRRDVDRGRELGLCANLGDEAKRAVDVRVAATPSDQHGPEIGQVPLDRQPTLGRDRFQASVDDAIASKGDLGEFGRQDPLGGLLVGRLDVVLAAVAVRVVPGEDVRARAATLVDRARTVPAVSLLRHGDYPWSCASIQPCNAAGE